MNRKTNTRQTGREGERIALSILAGKGYEILAQNYQKRCGEIDIIARSGNVVAFVEVKYRKSLKVSTPEESVTARKRERMVKTAETYIHEKGEELRGVNFRFDVIAIRNIKGETSVIHYENAFTPEV